MRRPLTVKRATGVGFTFFLFIPIIYSGEAPENLFYTTMPSNEKQWSSANPGLIVILLDQSGSMLGDYEGGDSKTVFASKAVNKVIDNLIQKNYNGDVPKNRCFVSVIGYNHNVKELCSGWLSELDENPLKVETVKEKQPNGNGGIIEIEVEQPIWVEPITEDGATNMKGAFELAKELVSKWMSDHATEKDPAPIIINISDGEPYYEGKHPEICMKETKEVAQSIMAMSNADGNVLIFNARIEKDGGRKVFPNSESELKSAEEKFIYESTSYIPESYKKAARKVGLDVKEGSKGCIFEADGIQLIQLINFGSSMGQGDLR